MKILRNLLVSAVLVLATLVIRPATVHADPPDCQQFANACQSMVGCSDGLCFIFEPYTCFETPPYYESWGDWECYWEGNENYPPIQYASGECSIVFYFCL
jgi:hypothetical protein